MFLMTGEDDLPRELLDAPRERLLMEIRLLRDEAHHRRVAELDEALRLTQHQLRDTETRLMHSRDFAIGAAAEVGEHRALLEQEALRNKKLKNELNRVYKSSTWRIGRMMLLPIRAIRKISRRR
jgi:hypothetical protein